MPTRSSGPADDWLTEGLDGRSARTVRLNHDVLKLVTAVIGGIELRLLTAPEVRRALVHVAAGNSSRTVTLAHNELTRALRHAEANRHVAHNVAALVDTPAGQPGRPSKALTAEQAAALLEAAEGSRLGAYVVLCLMTGIRTEEARALRWDHVDLGAASIAVWRSVRLGGDTKTSKSRRTLGLPQAVIEALREHRVRQAEEKVAAGDLWREHNLVFTTAVRTELDAANVRRSFRSICKAAGVGEGWTPRELRTSFVSLGHAGRDRPPGRPLKLTDNGSHRHSCATDRHRRSLRLITSAPPQLAVGGDATRHASLMLWNACVYRSTSCGLSRYNAPVNPSL